VEACTCTLQYI